MEFEKKPLSCLEPVLREVQSCEQTQQLRLSDAMPDVGKVLAVWGQVVLRGKEWRGGMATVTGGVLVWVLYAPEDGSQARCLDGWVPFQLRWDLPEGIPEGKLRVHTLLQYADGRSVSPRKLLIRCAVSAMAEVLSPMEQEVYLPEKIPEGVEVLRNIYPINLPREAGEKAFAVEETLALPESMPQPEELICCRMAGKVQETKVLSDKAVFRGVAELHLLYRSEEGQLHCWDQMFPFSQFVELETVSGGEANVEVLPELTGLEVELDDEGHFRVKAGFTGQYLVYHRELVEVGEDAYSPERELNLQMEELSLPVILQQKQECLSVQQQLQADANVVVDVSFLPDFPRQYRNGDQLELEISGMFQVLYYGADSALQGAAARWEGQITMTCGEDTRVMAMPSAGMPEAAVGNDQIRMKTELTLDLQAGVIQRIPMLTALTLGQPRTREPGRPSVILCRAGEARLWDVAKENGSTLEAIRRINHLTGEPTPDQLLLIPVG